MNREIAEIFAAKLRKTEFQCQVLLLELFFGGGKEIIGFSTDIQILKY